MKTVIENIRKISEGCSHYSNNSFANWFEIVYGIIPETTLLNRAQIIKIDMNDRNLTMFLSMSDSSEIVLKFKHLTEYERCIQMFGRG